MKRGLSCGVLHVWTLLNHRGHRGNAEVNSSFVPLAHFRAGFFLHSSVSSVVDLKLKN